MFLSNESVGSGGVGPGHGFDGFGGGGAILGIIALLAVLRNQFHGGNFDGARNTGIELSEQLGSIRADIGETKYDTVSSIMSQTNTLLSSICEGRMENISALFNQTNALQGELFGLSKQMGELKYDLGSKIDHDSNLINMNILKQGYENQLANCHQTNVLSRQADECCCRTNEHIERTAFQTQLRDLENKCDTDAKLKELECGQKAIIGKIEENRLLDENRQLKQQVDALREKDERAFIAAQASRTNCLVTQFADAQKAYASALTPTTPFPWSIPVCGCVGY